MQIGEADICHLVVTHLLLLPSSCRLHSPVEATLALSSKGNSPPPEMLIGVPLLEADDLNC